MTIYTIFSQTLDTDGDGQDGYTRVMGFAPAALTLPSGAILRIRFTLQSGSSQGLTLDGAYVEHAAASGDAYDFLQTPVQLLWSGSTSKAIPPNSSATTDWAVFSYNKTSNLLISTHCNGGTGADMQKYKSSVSNVTDYYKAAASEAATVNKSGYTTQAGVLTMVNKIEVLTSTGAVIFI